jgi:aryl carrier-like protein
VRAAAVAVRDAGNSRQLVAYVVPEQGQTLDETDVTDHLCRSLPDYMVPRACVFIPELPLTVNGKVDRAALPAPPEREASPAEQTGSDALLDDMCAAWESVLQLRDRRGRPVSATDDFVQAGGDSIQAMRLTLALNELGIRVDAADILRHRTVNGLSEHVLRPTREAAGARRER